MVRPIMQRAYLLLLIVMMSLASHATAADNNNNLIINRLVIFGDSLSDQGKLYRKSNSSVPVSPPYWNGRFSNGPIWADILAKQYELVNEAEGGAAAVDYTHLSGDIQYRFINSLENEINQFLSKSSFHQDDLVVIWIGGNDYLTYHWTRREDIDRVVLELIIQIRRLERLGVKHILAINLPNMGQAPLASNAGLSQLMTDVTEYHNLQMQTLFTQAFDPNFVKIFDAASIFNTFTTSPQEYGFLNTHDPCYTGDYFGIPWSQSQDSVRHFKETPATHDNMGTLSHDSAQYRINWWTQTPECKGFIYMDAIHPSKDSHALSAKALNQYIRRHYSQ